jgi:Fe-S cluster assembly iron-binding protein IscA
MLTITPEASEALRVILDSDGVPEGAEVRISSPPQSQNGSGPDAALAIEIVDAAPEEDQRVRGEDIEVAIDPAAAEMLDDKQLDAQVGEGRVDFTITDQDAGSLG